MREAFIYGSVVVDSNFCANSWVQPLEVIISRLPYSRKSCPDGNHFPEINFHVISYFIPSSKLR